VLGSSAVQVEKQPEQFSLDCFTATRNDKTYIVQKASWIQKENIRALARELGIYLPVLRNDLIVIPSSCTFPI